MILRPCIVCGEPAPSTSCDEHRPKDSRTNRAHVAWRNDAAWKNLSRRLRRLAPFCELCGSSDRLSVDHLLPVAEFPELVYAAENCRVLCLSCNGSRGNRWTATDAEHVAARLAESYRRRPTTTGRARLDAAQRARGEAPPEAGYPTRGKAKFESEIR